MIDEGFCLPRVGGHAEDVGEELFYDKEVGGRIEVCVKGEDGTGAFEAVSGKVELRCRVYCVEKWEVSGGQL